MRSVLGLLVLVVVAGFARGETKRSYVGVQIANSKDEVLIQRVLPDSPAAKAGLKGGDVLVSIDGLKPTNVRDAVAAIRSLKPKKSVTFLVRRDGKEKKIKVTPEELGK